MYSIRQLADLLDISYQRCWCLVRHVQPVRLIGDRAFYGQDALDTLRVLIAARKPHKKRSPSS
jgi:hypothetical protein